MVETKERPLSSSGLMKGVNDDDDDEGRGADGFKHFGYNSEINAHLASK